MTSIKLTTVALCASAMMMLSSCQSALLDNVQGVYVADKQFLRKSLESTMETNNRLASALFNRVIENAIIEFKIKADSIEGLIFIAGQSTLIKSKIKIQNDSLVIKSDKLDAYIIHTDTALFFKSKSSAFSIKMIKSSATNLSPETNEALSALRIQNKQQEQFESNLGRWQIGRLVDEFGDATGESYVYSVVRGSHENSAVTNSDVYVKSFIQGESLYFEVFNTSMSMKETFPDSEFGTIKIKFPNGDVKSERVFFYQNSVSEAPDSGPPLIYTHLKKGGEGLKILIDLSTVSRYQKDKYQFSIGAVNLAEALSGI
ncbi:hypothetical protein [Chryseosolibacter indicus]|uniref:DUF4292 domain-containing protein n=1 Tax=Chryseosolibacter indicus TaxID=2782351 RepID=A0ABS5VX27_9BACT|nr:hypothetical protein [Chryseosolibacter indicus]MBT1705289.1 hypothetical protein [Chryseosolibacter indicus]